MNVTNSVQFSPSGSTLSPLILYCSPDENVSISLPPHRQLLNLCHPDSALLTGHQYLNKLLLCSLCSCGRHSSVPHRSGENSHAEPEEQRLPGWRAHVQEQLRLLQEGGALRGLLWPLQRSVCKNTHFHSV